MQGGKGVIFTKYVSMRVEKITRRLAYQQQFARE